MNDSSHSGVADITQRVEQYRISPAIATTGVIRTRWALVERSLTISQRPTSDPAFFVPSIFRSPVAGRVLVGLVAKQRFPNGDLM